MKLFNEYYNTDFQFLLELYSLNRPFSRKEAAEIAKKTHAYTPFTDFTYALNKWADAGIIIMNADGSFEIKKEKGMHSFAAPLNNLESEYLSEICTSEVASLFLKDNLIGMLSMAEDDFSKYIVQNDLEKVNREIKKISPEVFHNLIWAIYKGCYVSHDYCTNNSTEIQTAKIIPYRLETSVFDGRWWLIAYNENLGRPIKAKLENIKAVRPEERHNADLNFIENSILQNLVPEPVVLQIKSGKNAVERCFMIFEDMQEISAYKISEEEYELHFKYFKWDRNIVVRKMLYLGENVIMKSPEPLKQEVVAEIKKAIANEKTI